MTSENGYLQRIKNKMHLFCLNNFNNRKKYYWLFGTAVLVMVFFSFSTLTTKPRIWCDEALSIELSHNFMLFQKLDVQSAPGVFSGSAENLQSTGYPVLVPAALFFKIFGFGFVQVRIYMILWMVLTLGMIFILSSRIFGHRLALASALLMITFASFYGNGRTLVGEVPGLFFLITGLYFWWIKDRPFLAGILFGLAVVTKPSVYLGILPAIFLVTIFYEKKLWRRKLALIAVGTLPAALVWILLVLPHPFTPEPWLKIYGFFMNPYESMSIVKNIIGNLLYLPHQLSIVYFILLLLPAFFIFFKIDDRKMKVFYHFTIIYSIFSFLYYLRSPGWMRYLFTTQMLIFMLFPFVVENLVLIIKKKLVNCIFLNSALVFNCVISFFIVLQIAQFFWMSHLYTSDAALKTVEYVVSNFDNKTVGVINAPEVAAFIDPERKFQIINHLVGIPQLGDVNSWPFPDVIVFNGSDQHGLTTLAPLLKNYKMINNLNGYEIYKIIN